MSDEHVVTDRTTRLPTEAEIADINARHLIETPLRPADMLFVFGTREDIDARVDEACRLWREHYRALNTGENVIFSLPIIDAALGLNNIRSVICLGNTWTARRYPMTLHRHWPEVEKMLITVDSFATPRSLWHTDPEFSRRMLSEWDKIELYKARGFIAEWPASGEGDRAG